MNKPPYKAPDFSLIGDDDERHELKDYAGNYLVIYFYPKDEKPGCTTQACSIRDVYDDFTKKNVALVGISMDTPEDHRAFKANHDLPFILLSDPMGKTIRAYRAWGKKMFGREGILRKTFIIDPDGTVQKVYGRAVAAGHGQAILDDLKILQTKK